MSVCTTSKIEIAMMGGTTMPVCTTRKIEIAMVGGNPMPVCTTSKIGTGMVRGAALVGGTVQENPVLPLVKKYFLNTKQLYLWREQAEFSRELIKGVFIRSFPKLRSHEYCH